MKSGFLLLIVGLVVMSVSSSCRAYARGEARTQEIEHGPEPIPTGPPRDYARYGITPDGSGGEDYYAK